MPDNSYTARPLICRSPSGVNGERAEPAEASAILSVMARTISAAIGLAGAPDTHNTTAPSPYVAIAPEINGNSLPCKRDTSATASGPTDFCVSGNPAIACGTATSPGFANHLQNTNHPP